MAPDAYTSRHWRVRMRLTFADDPPTVTRLYCAWVSAGDETAARALVATEVESWDSLDRSEVIELEEVTSGKPGVIAVWEDR